MAGNSALESDNYTFFYWVRNFNRQLGTSLTEELDQQLKGWKLSVTVFLIIR